MRAILSHVDFLEGALEALDAEVERALAPNRAENSHRPTRRRERVRQRFKSPAHAQQFLAPFGPISDHFRPRRQLLPAPRYRQTMQTRFTTWREVTGLAAA